jgi:hypothetical protein
VGEGVGLAPGELRLSETKASQSKALLGYNNKIPQIFLKSKFQFEISSPIIFIPCIFIFD